MKSSKQYQEEIDALDENAFWHEITEKYNGLQRAIFSEAFKAVVLPQFMPLVKECIEKSAESFFILLHTGQKYIYYSSKARLVPVHEKGKQGQNVFLLPLNFMQYFAFIKPVNNAIAENVFCDGCGNKYEEKNPAKELGEFNLCLDCRKKTDLRSD